MVNAEASSVLELRCPAGPKALLAKMSALGERPQVDSGNRLMLHCRDCVRAARKQDPSVFRVIHHFDLAGRLVESTIERRP